MNETQPDSHEEYAEFVESLIEEFGSYEEAMEFLEESSEDTFYEFGEVKI